MEDGLKEDHPKDGLTVWKHSTERETQGNPGKNRKNDTRQNAMEKYHNPDGKSEWRGAPVPTP